MSKKLKISKKEKPRMVESSLKIKQDPYADGGEIAKLVGPGAISAAELEAARKKAAKDKEEAAASMQSHLSDEEPEMMAGGGEVAEKELEDAASAVASIMAKRRMARGGEILSQDDIESDPDADQADLAGNAEESQNQADQLGFNALRKENYSESDALDQIDHPEDSNLHDVDIDSDEHDMVSSIRKKIKRPSSK